jgi:hypothetical protein
VLAISYRHDVPRHDTAKTILVSAFDSGFNLFIENLIHFLS